jgi:RHS repeat-associated protein
MCVAFIRAAKNVRIATNPRPDTATPLNGTGVSLGVQTFLSAWAEYDPSDCTEVTSGTWTLNSSPAYGTVSTGTITGPSGCNGGTFTYGAIYYTLTSATAMTDSFSATWNGDGRTSPEGGTFSLVAFDLAKNNGDCGCNTAGNPVNAGTGNKYEAQTDFVGAPNTGLELRRYYNSMATVAAGAFGANWSSTFQRSISVVSAGSVVQANLADGRVETFTYTSGAYVGDPDVVDRLYPVPASGTQTGWQLVRADDSVEAYTLAGLLSTITTRAGLVTTLTYNGSNHLITVTGPFGHTLTFAYDGSGRVIQMTVPDGGAYAYAYDANDNLVSVTYPSAAVRQYVYAATNFPNSLTGIIDENGNPFATWTYEFTSGYAISSQHAGGADLTTLTYNSSGSTSVTDARGYVHTYVFSVVFGSVKPTAVTGVPVQDAGGQAFTYDTNGFIASSTDWDGNVTTYTHDTRGDETSRTSAYGTANALAITTSWLSNFHLPSQSNEGNRTFNFAYDAHGNLLTKTLTATGPASTWTYTYNGAGQVLTATDPDGHVTTYAYDVKGDVVSITNALGQITLFTSYDADGRPLTMQDPNGLVTTLTYNFRGEITSKTEAQWVTTYTYDAVGQLIKLTRPDGSFLAFTYDAAHRLVGIADALGNGVVYTLDASSNRIQTQVFGASNNLTWTHSYSYDGVNRLVQAIGAVGQTTNYAYDTNSNLTQITDPVGNATKAAYDALNRLVQSTDPNGGLTALGYDPESRLNSVTDPRTLTTSYAYDGLDDVTSLGSPDTGVTAMTYDAAGNLVGATDARGDTTTYSYDALNRVTKAAFADGSSITYQYDQGANGIGHLTAMTDAGGTTTWNYNINGQVTSKQQTSGAVTLTTSHAYNATTAQLASTTYPSGAIISYSYDADGRVSAMGYQPPGGQTISLLSNIAYQPFGPAASWTPGGGGSYRRTFDLDGRIVALALSPAGLDLALTYDADSRITGIAERNFPTKTFGYDALSRLTNYATGASVQPLSTMDAITRPHDTMRMDAITQPRSPISFGASTQTYTYDANGNRTGFTAKAPLNTAALTYSYATASNRLLGIGGSETDSFTYDANGNMLSHSSPAANYSYTYNARNRRAEATVGAVTTTDVINGLGQRTAQTLAGTDFFVYDEAGHLIGSYNGQGGVIEETVWLGDLPVATMSPGTLLSPRGIFYIAPDQLGAPHEITNASGAIVWRWDHDPFGNGAPSGPLPYPLRFPGQYDDQLAKLHYNNFRDYDPNTGRYIESDRIGLAAGINTYAYVLDNPVSLTDRFGLLTLTGSATSNNYVSPNGSVQPLSDTTTSGYSNNAGQGFMGSRPRTSNEQGACFNYAPPFPLGQNTTNFAPFHFAQNEGTNLNQQPVYSWVNGNPNTPGGSGNDVIYSTAPYMQSTGVINK